MGTILQGESWKNDHYFLLSTLAHGLVNFFLLAPSLLLKASRIFQQYEILALPFLCIPCNGVFFILKCVEFEFRAQQESRFLCFFWLWRWMTSVTSNAVCAFFSWSCRLTTETEEDRGACLSFKMFFFFHPFDLIPVPFFHLFCSMTRKQCIISLYPNLRVITQCLHVASL